LVVAKKSDKTPETDEVIKEAEETIEKKEDPAEVTDADDTAEELESDLENKLAEITDRLQRTMAEFDNFRKRTEKEKAARFEVGARNVIEQILPVLDNFERGLLTVPEEKKSDPFADGMDKVYKQMLSVLEDLGVKEIEALGKEFNPDYHNAVMHVEDEEAGENMIVEEFQKGYLYKDGVVRYSMVKVAN